jgi:hypothetical protein
VIENMLDARARSSGVFGHFLKLSRAEQVQMFRIIVRDGRHAHHDEPPRYSHQAIQGGLRVVQVFQHFEHGDYIE